MGRTWMAAAVVWAALGGSVWAQPSQAHGTNKWSWGENVGFMNWRDGGTPAGARGLRVHSNFLSGLVWCENIGWLDLGDATPSAGSTYLNAAGDDFGVNVDGAGNLFGMAWGENVGWVNFMGGALASPANPARIEGHRLRGYAWGENVGWINLDHAQVFVGIIPAACPGDTNGDMRVDFADLNNVLSLFGQPTTPVVGADLNGDGVVNFVDLNLVLGFFGSVC